LRVLECAGEIPASLWTAPVYKRGDKALQKCAKLEVQAPAESLWARVPCMQRKCWL
jgi:hypothetical protein